MTHRRVYDKEFKLRAIEMVVRDGRRVCDVAQDLGIPATMLSRWKSALTEGQEEAFPGTGHRTASEEELHKVKRELEIAKEERDILKKALAIFSKKSG